MLALPNARSADIQLKLKRLDALNGQTVDDQLGYI
jgi:hypothetical protein